jgi:cytochrome c-type biogenesis protein CcmH
MDLGPQCSRRGFLGATAGVVAARLGLAQAPPLPASPQDSLPGAGPSGRLFDPSRAGRPMDPTIPQDNDAAIQAIEKGLKCTCGCNLDIYTCRTTDFTCQYSPALHREVVALHDSGKTAQEIVDDFVRRHGVAILMAPPRRGFNLAGYFVPSLVILAAAVVLVVVLRRWTRGAAAPAPAALDPTASGSAPELERLRQELERFPG